jgi:hypothetical protein
VELLCGGAPAPELVCQSRSPPNTPLFSELWVLWVTMCWILISITCSRGRLQDEDSAAGNIERASARRGPVVRHRAQEHEGVEHRSTKRTRMLAGTHADTQRSNWSPSMPSIIDRSITYKFHTHWQLLRLQNEWKWQQLNENYNCYWRGVRIAGHNTMIYI